MSRAIIRRLCGIGVLALAASVARAGGAADASVAQAIPSSPAFEALGATPTAILRPGSVKEFAGELLGAAGGRRVAGGLALEFAPLWDWKYAEKTTLPEWRAKGSAARYWSWLGVSIATTPASDGATHAAVGLRQALIDSSDPRFDETLEHCIAAALRKAREEQHSAGPPDPTGDGAPEVVLVPNLRPCREAHERRYANGVGDSLVVAAAATGRMADQLAEKFEWDSVLFWVAGARGIGPVHDDGARRLQIVASARYRYSWLLHQHQAVAGARLRWARPDLGLSVDASWQPEFPDSSDPVLDVLAVSASFEWEILKGLWLAGTPGITVRGGEAEWTGTLGVRIGAQVLPIRG
jgi:hypothetical protein